MFNINTRAGIFACLITLSLSTSASFAQQSTGKEEGFEQFTAILNKMLQSNPEILAAQAAVVAATHGLKGAELPLNNPEIGIESERTDTNYFAFSYSQTIDWHDKQKGRQRVAQSELSSALAELESLRLALGSELLETMGKVASNEQITALSKQRTVILNRFVQLAEKRFSAGDISKSEQELANLSLSEAIMQHAGNAAALIQSRGDYSRLTGEEPDARLTFPNQLPTQLPNTASDTTLIEQHPDFRVAWQLAQVARLQIRNTGLERKVDPVFTVTGGRDADETLIGVSLAIPLTFRNNFSSSVDIARAQSLQAEQQMQQVKRTLSARIKNARERYMLVSGAWSQWLTRGNISLQQRIEILEVQWQSGEISTSDYLLQVQQTLDTRITSAELHGNQWSAWVDWLSGSGTLSDWFNLSN